MNEEEIRKLIERAYSEDNPVTNEGLKALRDALIAAYETDYFQILGGLERVWRLIEPPFQVVDREYNYKGHPLASLAYYADVGLYPPPEILLAVAGAYNLYASRNGEISLDEAFFGQSHKKTSSYAHKNFKQEEYSFFHSVWVRRRKEDDRKKSMSMEELATDYYEWMTNNPIFGDPPKTDIDTFLRNYRRWVVKHSK